MNPPGFASRRRMYAPLALLVAGIALTGFWPTFFGPMIAGAWLTFCRWLAQPA